MTARLAGLCCALLVWAAPALAAPERSLHPVARPDATPETIRRELKEAGIPGFNPQDVVPHMARSFVARSPQAVGRSPRPAARPGALVQRAMARQREQVRGSVCGDPDLQGEEVGFVPGKLPGCGLTEAVRLRSVSGVALSQQALIDCPTAKALKRWTEGAVKPAVGSIGGGVAGLQVAAHYICRSRNNVPGAAVSEHGRGKAIDISAVRLRDGSDISVLRDWGRGAKGRALARMHTSACGTFGTVLGPGSDGYHEDHLHLDTARHGNGAYCR